MELKAQPIGRGLQKGGGMFSPAPFATSSRSVLSGVSLGETEQSLYVRGKAAVAKYDDLMNRLGTISDETYRDRVLARVHGDPKDPTAAVRIRNAVYASVTEAENDMPVNYDVFSNKPVQQDIAAIETLDRTFEELVKSGESAYGTEERAESSTSLEGPSLGLNTSSVLCAASGLVILGTIVYFALK